MEQVYAATITAIAAIVGAVLALVGVVITVRKSNKDLLKELEKRSELDDQKLDAKLEKFTAVTDTKIAELTREVREHNNFARRMPVVEEQIKNIFHQINEIKSDGK